MGLFSAAIPHVMDGNKDGLDQWVITYEELLQSGTNAAQAINTYCKENNCYPVSVANAYNSVAFGGALECIAVVRKNGL